MTTATQTMTRVPWMHEVLGPFECPRWDAYDGPPDAIVRELLPRRRIDRFYGSYRKLTDEQVLEIRVRRAGGATIRQLCRDYGLSQRPMWNLITGLTYQDVSSEPWQS